MCDIYYAVCSHVNCSTMIMMHLEDFETPREDIEVFCENHLPLTDVRIFHLYSNDDRKYTAGGHSSCGVRYLTDLAKQHKDGNHPTAEEGQWEIEDR